MTVHVWFQPGYISQVTWPKESFQNGSPFHKSVTSSAAPSSSMYTVDNKPLLVITSASLPPSPVNQSLQPATSKLKSKVCVLCALLLRSMTNGRTCTWLHNLEVEFGRKWLCSRWATTGFYTKLLYIISTCTCRCRHTCTMYMSCKY